VSFLLELLFQVVFEFVSYGVGRAVLLVLAPHYGVESQTRSPKRPWHWRGFSFARDGKRYFYVESVQWVGFGVLVLVVLAVVLVLANKPSG
jgi:hypothetical protein